MRKFFILLFLSFYLIAAEDPFMAKTNKCINEKDTDSCNEVANLIILDFKNGQIQKEYVELMLGSIVRMLEISCNENNSSVGCNMLGLIFTGDINFLPPIIKNDNLSFNYLSKACLLNSGHACFMVGIKNENNKDISLPFFKKGCELGTTESRQKLKTNN